MDRGWASATGLLQLYLGLAERANNVLSVEASSHPAYEQKMPP